MSGFKDLFGDELYTAPEGEAFARNSDPETSHAAARSMRGEPGGKVEAMVAAVVIASGERGVICDEIVSATGLNWNTVSPRIKQLINKKVITARMIEGKYVTREAVSGRSQRVLYGVKDDAVSN